MAFARFIEYILVSLFSLSFCFEVVEGKSSKKAKKEPTREEMHAVVVNILKEVDFNTVSFIHLPFIACYDSFWICYL